MITEIVNLGAKERIALHDSIDFDDQQEQVAEDHPMAIASAQKFADSEHQPITVHPKGAAAVYLFRGVTPVYPRKVVYPSL